MEQLLRSARFGAWDLELPAPPIFSEGSGNVPGIVEIEVVLEFHLAALRVGDVSLSCKTFSNRLNCSQPLTRRKFFSAASKAAAVQRRIIRGPSQRLTWRGRRAA